MVTPCPMRQPAFLIARQAGSTYDRGASLLSKLLTQPCFIRRAPLCKTFLVRV